MMILFLLFLFLVEGKDCEIDQWDIGDLSEHTILNRIAELDKPVLIKGALKDIWSKALDKWDNQTYFMENYGSIYLDKKNIVSEPVEVALNGPGPVIGDEISLKEWNFLDGMIFERERLEDSALKQLEKDLNEIVPNVLRPLSFGWFIVSIGSQDEGLIPHRHSASWLGLVTGEKKWFISPPEELNTEAMLIGRDKSPMDDYELGIELYAQTVYNVPSKYSANIRKELYDRKGLFECVQRPGDIIFIPHLWWHSTENIGNAIALGAQSTGFHLPDEIKPKRPYKDAITLTSECEDEERSDWARPSSGYIPEDCLFKNFCAAWKLEPYNMNYIRNCVESKMYTFFSSLGGKRIENGAVQELFVNIFDFMIKISDSIMTNIDKGFISEKNGNHIMKRIKKPTKRIMYHITNSVEEYYMVHNITGAPYDWVLDENMNEYKEKIDKIEL